MQHLSQHTGSWSLLVRILARGFAPEIGLCGENRTEYRELHLRGNVLVGFYRVKRHVTHYGLRRAANGEFAAWHFCSLRASFIGLAFFRKKEDFDSYATIIGIVLA